LLRRVDWCKFTDVSEVLVAFVISAIEAASTSEKSLNFYQTAWDSSLEVSHLEQEMHSSWLAIRPRLERFIF
jgi:hypothetical protein